MSSLNISCAVCKEKFKPNDSLYSTNCGHVFHFTCMNRWKCQYTSCPVCRSYNPTTQPIYINFENDAESESLVSTLKSNLEGCKNEIKKLQQKLDKNVEKTNGIRRLYNISEQWRGELELKIHTLKQQNAELSKDLAKHLETNEILQTYPEMLGKDKGVEELMQKCKDLALENRKLKENVAHNETLQIVLNQKVEMQDLRLKLLNKELAKQFDNRFKIANQPESVGNERNKKPKKVNRNQNKKHEDAKDVSIEEPICVGSDTKNGKYFESTRANDRKMPVLPYD